MTCDNGIPLLFQLLASLNMRWRVSTPSCGQCCGFVITYRADPIFTFDLSFSLQTYDQHLLEQGAHIHTGSGCSRLAAILHLPLLSIALMSWGGRGELGIWGQSGFCTSSPSGSSPVYYSVSFSSLFSTVASLKHHFLVEGEGFHTSDLCTLCSRF